MTTRDKGVTIANQADNAALTVESVYLHMQGLLQKGLVVIVGSGASCAYGLPGMSDLAASKAAPKR